MTQLRIPLVVLAFLLTTSCSQDVGLVANSICDGIAQPAEDWVDQPFDKDEDGFFDGTNPDCLANYDIAFLDCDDQNPDVNPEVLEITCDGVDNDCNDETLDGEDLDDDGWDECEDCDDNDAERNPALSEVECDSIDNDCDDTTPDSVDEDEDGSSSCDDCNDSEPLAYPGRNEECEDNIDNDCDGEVDEDCEPADYTGSYELDTTVHYSCAGGAVSLHFSEVSVLDFNPSITVKAGGSQPGQMTGTRSEAGVFAASRTITGTCDETYSITGEFTSETTFDATFEAAYSGGACGTCSDQIWSISGTML